MCMFPAALSPPPPPPPSSKSECMDPILMNDCTASVVTPVQHYTCHSRRGMFLR